MKKHFIFAVASLVGVIIGAGIFGIPYIVAQSGVLTSFFYFIILGAVVLTLHLFFAEIVLNTKEDHRLVGYAQKYLGKSAKNIVFFSTIIGDIGSLLVYIILAGKFSHFIFPSALSETSWSLIIWFLLSALVVLGIKTISRVELWLNLALFAVFLTIFFFCLPKIEAINFTLINTNNLFLPFGVVLFSLIGLSAVPEVAHLLGDKKRLRYVIVTAGFITVIFSFLFGLVISGVSGPLTTTEPFAGLSNFLGRGVVLLGAFFGLLAVSTSFLMIANYLKNTLILDCSISRWLSIALTCLGPAILFLAGVRNFIAVIGLVGVLVGLLEGSAIALIYRKIVGSQLKTRLLVYGLITVLFLGVIAQALYFKGYGG
jgi:amino acid permease